MATTPTISTAVTIAIGYGTIASGPGIIDTWTGTSNGLHRGLRRGHSHVAPTDLGEITALFLVDRRTGGGVSSKWNLKAKEAGRGAIAKFPEFRLP